MSLVQHDHVIQAIAANTSDEPLHIGVLPGTPWGNHDFIAAHTPDTLPKACPVDAVAITQEIPWGVIPWKSVDHLLRRPLRGGMLSDVDVHNPLPLVGEDHEYEENLIGHCRDDEEIHGDQVLDVVLEKPLPRRRGWRA